MDLSAYTMFPGIALIVVDGFYSIVKLVAVVSKGLLKQKARSASDVGDEVNLIKGQREDQLQQALNHIFQSASFP